jgi:hypothetical protein
LDRDDGGAQNRNTAASDLEAVQQQIRALQQEVAKTQALLATKGTPKGEQSGQQNRKEENGSH